MWKVVGVPTPWKSVADVPRKAMCHDVSVVGCREDSSIRRVGESC